MALFIIYIKLLVGAKSCNMSVMDKEIRKNGKGLLAGMSAIMRLF